MRYSAVVAVAAFWLSAAPQATAQAIPPVAGAAAQPQTGIGSSVMNPSQASISGRVMAPNGNPIANATVRARNLITGQVGGSTPIASAGQFSLNVNPGSYLLEVVDAGGQIVGTSSFISAAAGSSITATTVTVTTGALTTVTTAAGLVSTLSATAARSVTYAAAAAGVAGVITPADVITASPSR